MKYINRYVAVILLFTLILSNFQAFHTYGNELDNYIDFNQLLDLEDNDIYEDEPYLDVQKFYYNKNSGDIVVNITPFGRTLEEIRVLKTNTQSITTGSSLNTENDELLIENFDYILDENKITILKETIDKQNLDNNIYLNFIFNDLSVCTLEIESEETDEIAFSDLEVFNTDINNHIIVPVVVTSMQAIRGVDVLIDDEPINVDIDYNNLIYTPQEGEHKVTLIADGYKTISSIYKLKKNEFKYLFLEEDLNDDIPYVSMAMEMTNKIDLLNEPMYIPSNVDAQIEIAVEGEWKNKFSREYIIYQEDKNGNSINKISDKNGKFIFNAGKNFDYDLPVKLKLVDSDGVESEPITLNIHITPGLKTEDIDIKTINPVNAEVNNKDIVSFFLNDVPYFNMALEKLPVDIKTSAVTADGSLIIKAFIGFMKFPNGATDESRWEEQQWTNIKSEFNKAKNDVKRMRALINEMKAVNRVGKFDSRFAIDTAVIGYAEIKLDAFRNISYVEGGVIFDVMGSFKYTGQFMAGPVPLYYELGLGAKGNFGAGLRYDTKSVKPGLQLEGTFMFDFPSLTAGAGVGINGLASGGVEGNLLFNMTQKLGSEVFNEYAKVGIDYYAGVKFSILFFIKFTFKIVAGSSIIYEHPKNNYYDIEDRSPELEDKEIRVVQDFGFIDRSFAEKTSQWNGENITRGDNTIDTITSLQDWILPSSMPQISTIPNTNKLLMIFQGNDIRRSIADSTVLLYSIYDGISWSVPKYVYNNGTADMFAQIGTSKNDLYIIWQKSNSKINSTDIDDVMSEVKSKSEIYLAKLNKTTLEFDEKDITRVTNDKYFNLMPSLAFDENDELIVSLIAINGIRMGIKAAKFNNGKLGEFQEIESSNKSDISEMVLGYSAKYYTSNTFEPQYIMFAEIRNGKASVYRTLNKLPSPSKTSIESESIESESIEFNSTEFNSDAVSLKYSDKAFYWYQDGHIHEVDFSAGDVTNPRHTNISAGEGLMSASYEVISNGSRVIAIVWVDFKRDDTLGLFIPTVMASLKTGNEWSSPIELMALDGPYIGYSIQNMSVTLTEDYSWAIVINGSREEDGEEEDNYKNSLLYAHIPNKVKTSLDYVVEGEVNSQGNKQDINYSISNLGEKVIDEYILNIHSDDGKINVTEKISTSLKPGETIFESYKLDISSVTSKKEITVDLLVEGDFNDTNKSHKVTLGFSDLFVDAKVYERLEEYFLIIRVNAESNMQVNNAVIKIEEDSLGGKLVDNIYIPQINRDGAIGYMYRISKNGNPIENFIKNYFISATASESYPSNLTTSANVVLYNPDISYNPALRVDKLNNYNIVVSASEDGSVYGEGSFNEGGSVYGEGSFNEGELVTIIATPNENYKFDGWYENGVRIMGDEETYTFEVDRHRSFHASFIDLTNDIYNIKVTGDMGGYVSGSGEYMYNQEVTIKATPNENYKFDGWYVGKNKISDSETYTFNADRDIPINARFSPRPNN